MLCITGKEKTIDELIKRQKKIQSDQIIHELRLDYLKKIPDNPSELCIDPSKVLITFRRKDEGGAYSGDEKYRIETLAKFAIKGAGFIDLEYNVETKIAQKVLKNAVKTRCRVIRSIHLFNEPENNWEKIFNEVNSTRGHGTKFAVSVDDASNLKKLLELSKKRNRPLIILGMGKAGILSRIFYLRFGSFLSYVAINKKNITAQGQITWDEAKSIPFGFLKDPEPVVLIGGNQVYDSPGFYTYNQLFYSSEVKMAYSPVSTYNLKETIELLREIGMRGASITMPFKEDIINHLDLIDKETHKYGSVNTIIRNGKNWIGYNTDGEAVLEIFDKNLKKIDEKKILIIGVGGAARAAAWSLKNAGAKVCFTNRTEEKGRKISNILGVDFYKTEEVKNLKFDALINATPAEDIVEKFDIKKQQLKNCVVLDMNIKKQLTPLLEFTKNSGAVAIPGIIMWLHQGSKQASIWLKKEITAQYLSNYLPEEYQKNGLIKYFNKQSDTCCRRKKSK